MSIVVAMKNQAKFATKKSSQNLKKSRNTKVQQGFQLGQLHLNMEIWNRRLAI